MLHYLLMLFLVLCAQLWKVQGFNLQPARPVSDVFRTDKSLAGDGWFGDSRKPWVVSKRDLENVKSSSNRRNSVSKTDIHKRLVSRIGIFQPSDSNTGGSGKLRFPGGLGPLVVSKRKEGD